MSRAAGSRPCATSLRRPPQGEEHVHGAGLSAQCPEAIGACVRRCHFGHRHRCRSGQARSDAIYRVGVGARHIDGRIVVGSMRNTARGGPRAADQWSATQPAEQRHGGTAVTNLQIAVRAGVRQRVLGDRYSRACSTARIADRVSVHPGCINGRIVGARVGRTARCCPCSTRIRCSTQFGEQRERRSVLAYGDGTVGTGVECAGLRLGHYEVDGRTDRVLNGARAIIRLDEHVHR